MKKNKKTKGGSNTGLLVAGAIAAGAVYAFATGGSATGGSGSSSSVVPGNSPAPGGGGSATPKAPAPKPSPELVPAPTTAPEPKTNTSSQAKLLSPLQYVFVDSWNGEGLYERVRTGQPSNFDGYGWGRIVTGKPNEYVGARTATPEKNGMIELMVNIDGRFYYFWIDKEEALITNDAGYENKLAGSGFLTSVLTKNAVKTYFSK